MRRVHLCLLHTVLAGCTCLLHIEETQFPQPLLIVCSNSPGGPQLDLLQCVNAFLIFGSLQLVLESIQVSSSHKCQTEEEDLFPHLASSAAADTAEDVALLLCCKGTLLT